MKYPCRYIEEDVDLGNFTLSAGTLLVPSAPDNIQGSGGCMDKVSEVTHYAPTPWDGTDKWARDLGLIQGRKHGDYSTSDCGLFNLLKLHCDVNNNFETEEDLEDCVYDSFDELTDVFENNPPDRNNLYLGCKRCEGENDYGELSENAFNCCGEFYKSCSFDMGYSSFGETRNDPDDLEDLNWPTSVQVDSSGNVLSCSGEELTDRYLFEPNVYHPKWGFYNYNVSRIAGGNETEGTGISPDEFDLPNLHFCDLPGDYGAFSHWECKLIDVCESSHDYENLPLISNNQLPEDSKVVGRKFLDIASLLPLPGLGLYTPENAVKKLMLAEKLLQNQTLIAVDGLVIY